MGAGLLAPNAGAGFLAALLFLFELLSAFFSGFLEDLDTGFFTTFSCFLGEVLAYLGATLGACMSFFLSSFLTTLA